VPRLSDELAWEDEPDHLDLYEVLQMIETREAFEEFFHEDDEDETD
jgi:hypothetical protein